MPLDEIRIEGLERSEQLNGGLDQPAEQDGPEAEVGRGDGNRAAANEQRLDTTPVRRPAGRRDDKGPATTIQARGEVGDHGVTSRGFDDEGRAGEYGGVV